MLRNLFRGPCLGFLAVSGFVISGQRKVGATGCEDDSFMWYEAKGIGDWMCIDALKWFEKSMIRIRPFQDVFLLSLSQSLAGRHNFFVFRFSEEGRLGNLCRSCFSCDFRKDTIRSKSSSYIIISEFFS